MLEMYKRNRFREELLLDKCEEVLAIEVEIAHVDQRLFQLAPPNAAGMRPIGRCECGAPIHPGQNFCGVCGRSFTTLTQSRTCTRCGSGLRPGDQYCATCGHEAPDSLQTIEAPSAPNPGAGAPDANDDAASIASRAVAETVVIEAPPLEPIVPTPAAASNAAAETSDLPPVAALPSDAPAGFDWTAPPTVPDAAIAAAVEAAPHSTPTNPFVPLQEVVPPPPIVDPLDVTLPGEMPLVVPAAPTPAQPPGPASPSPDATDDAKQAAKAAKAAKAAEKQRVKEATARAKAKAKAARKQRKRGGDA